MKVSDLQRMLAKMDPDSQVVVAPMNQINGFVNDISPQLWKVIGGPAGFYNVLSLEEETIGEDELDLVIA